MGTLYREEVKCYDRGIFKGVIGFSIISFIILLLGFISDIVLFGEYYGVILAFSGVMAIVIITRLKRKMIRVYRYEIIDNEIIIEDVTKGKRIVKLNFNAKNIVLLDNLGIGYTGRKISKKYNFICNYKCKNVKTCVFEKDGKLYSFKFEPSDAFISKIKSLKLREM